jgi:aminomuconate-semialdehyde/2-hydroxymuconate-6-semialdehyde dehydrogenase
MPPSTAARAALNGPWGTMPLAKRIELLEALVAEINNRFDEFLEAECADTGKPKSLASHIDIPRGAANFKVFADMVKNVPSEFFEMATPDGKHLHQLRLSLAGRRQSASSVRGICRCC